MDALLAYRYPELVAGLWGACLAAWALCGRRAARALRLDRRAAAGALCAGAAAFAAARLTGGLGLPLIPDEYDHLDIAGNLARLGAFAVSRAGGLPELDALGPTYWPAGFHVALAALFRLAAPSIEAALLFNAAAAGLAGALCFLLARRLLEDESAAAAAVVFLALSPASLIPSATAGLTPLSQALLLAGALAALAARQNARLLPLAALAAALAIQARLENFLCALPILWAACSGRGRPGAAAAGLAALSAIPGLALLWRAMAAGEPFYALDGALLSDLARHALSNLAYFADPGGLNAVALPLALWGAWRLRRERRGLLQGAAAVSAALYLVYSARPVGELRVWNFTRYAAALQIPLALAAGAGLSRLRRLGRAGAAAACAALLAAAALAAAGARASARALSEERQKLDFMRASAALLPARVYVVSFSAPAVRVATGRPAVSAGLLLEDPAWTRRERLVYFKDYWAFLRPAQSARIEERLRMGYDFEPLAETTIGARPYGFWLLKRKT